MPAQKSKPGDTALSEIEHWQPLQATYDEFVRKYPGLGLSPGRWPLANVRRHHTTALLKAGALMRTHQRKWMAHDEKFGPALFAAITAGTPRPGSTS